MKRWLILTLGILLILLLSYIAFLNKKDNITQDILSQAQIIKKNPTFKNIHIKLKGEDFALTRELILLGDVSSKEDKLLASKLLHNIRGVTKIDNQLKVQTIKPIVKEVESIEVMASHKEEVIKEEQKVEAKIVEDKKEQSNTFEFNATQTVQKEENLSKENNKTNSTELNSTQKEINFFESNSTKDNNETNLSSCQEQLNTTLSKSKIHFAHNSSTIKTSSYKQLNNIISILKECSLDKIIIDGYTDNSGDAKYNLLLSQQRANRVKAYLVSKGIKKSSIEAFGHGAENPLASNETREGREKNRRIEFTIKGTK